MGSTDLPATMSAAVLTGHGGPERLKVLHDIPLPSPGYGELLLRVRAAGVNNTDLWTRRGTYGSPGDPDAVAGWRGEPLSFPRIQGGDILGEVVDVGPATDPGQVGKRVLVDPLYVDDDGELAVTGSERDGGFAQYVAIPAESAHDVGESPLTDVELAALPIAYGTAMGMLNRAQIMAGETLVVTGASGGVGLALVQLGAAHKARVVAVTSPGKEAAVLNAGAESVVLRTENDIASAVRRIAGTEPDAVADVVGGELLPALLTTLRDEGRVVVAGAIAGPVITLDLRTLYLRKRCLLGSTMHTPTEFGQLVQHARQASVRPVIACTYPLSEIHRAQDDFTKSDHIGKLVVLP